MTNPAATSLRVAEAVQAALSYWPNHQTWASSAGVLLAANPTTAVTAARNLRRLAAQATAAAEVFEASTR